MDVGSLVRIDSTGLGRTTHEIVAVFQDAQVKQLKKLRIMDERMFAKSGEEEDEDEGGIVFDHGDDEEEILLPRGLDIEIEPNPYIKTTLGRPIVVWFAKVVGHNPVVIK